MRTTYKAYFFKNHDPVLDEIDALWDKAGRPKFKKIEADGGPKASTLGSWRRRKTKRPQFATVKATARALGGDVVVSAKRLGRTKFLRS